MSQSPSYRRDTACASPESPKEGDFSPRQLCDNPKSLEEHETCEDQKDPIVNIIPDNCSSSLLNTKICAPPATNDLGKLCAGMPLQEQPIKKSHWRETRCFSASPIKMELLISTEFMETRALDGRFITLVSTQTQTDWEWVEQSLTFSCQVQKEIEDLESLQLEVVSADTDPGSSQEAEDAKMPQEEHDIRCVGPPRLIAFKPEPKQTPHVEKVPEVESKQGVHLAQCDYCQQLCQLFIHSELLGSETDLERTRSSILTALPILRDQPKKLFCCERAKHMRELILEEREKLVQVELDRKINVNVHVPIISEEEREAARLRARERLRYLQLQRESEKQDLNKDSIPIEIKHKAPMLSKEIPYINDKFHILRINIKNTTGMFTLLQETDGETKQREVMKKFYGSGKCFLTLCPDGTGNVFYPSGKAAIIISSAGAADFTYIILEDKDMAPSIKGIFTNNGYATCYYPNGVIWLNLTPVGGVCLSETGALMRRWNWVYFDLHVRNLPFKPLTFALGPHISVRIHSQEHMYVTFAHQKHSVRFSVGSKLKLICPESHDKPGQDVLQRYIQMKSSEIYSLLGQMQTCMSHPRSFIIQTQRLSRQMEKGEVTRKR